MNRNILALDFGSGKITAVLSAYDDETGTLRVRRTLTQPCKAVNACVVLDLQETQNALNKIFADISDYVSFNPSVIVGIRGSFLSFKRASGFKNTDGRNRIISTRDIADAVNNSVPRNLSDTLEVIDVLPQTYTIDGQTGIKNPRGMEGFGLEVETFISCALVTQLNNLNRALCECECPDYTILPSGICLAETLLKPEEKNNTTLFLDIGGENSSALLYHKGTILDGWELPIGAEMIVQEVADVLQNDLEATRTTLAQYEYGDDEVIDDVLDEASKKMLRAIKKELLQSMLFVKYPPVWAVLSGGGSSLSVREAAKNVFSLRKARLAAYDDLISDAEDADNPVYSAAIALTLHSLERDSQAPMPVRQKEEGFFGGLLAKLGLN